MILRETQQSTIGTYLKLRLQLQSLKVLFLLFSLVEKKMLLFLLSNIQRKLKQFNSKISFFVNDFCSLKKVYSAQLQKSYYLLCMKITFEGFSPYFEKYFI